jgi:hypothetical protein
VKFISYLPLPPDGISELSPSLDQLEEVVKEISVLRNKYDINEFSIQRGGTIGSQGLSESRLGNICPAGDGLVTLISQTDGTSVTPCVFIPGIQIGTIEGGVPVIDPDHLDSFLELKAEALENGYCPAHYLSTQMGNEPQFVQIKVQEATNAI